MAVEQLSSKVRRMAHCQGFWATCRWCKNQGFHPRWVAKALQGLV